MRIENPQPPGKGERDSGPPPRVFFFASWLLKSLHEAYMKYYVKALLSSSLCRVFFFASWLLKILHEAYMKYYVKALLSSSLCQNR